MTTPFSLPWENLDIDIHPHPPDGWGRVAVIGGWASAKKTRSRWPDAAVVGPLRTMLGIDLLVRSLLANPQIRVLGWDGPDLSTGERVSRAFWEVFSLGDYEGILEKAIGPVAVWATREVVVVLNREIRDAVAHLHDVGIDCDRPGGAIILPPPEAPSTIRAPHGDPGDRIAGDTLSDVWPRVLRRVLECGREVSTQHGETRELLNLVSVVRDPDGSLDEFRSSEYDPEDHAPEWQHGDGSDGGVRICRACARDHRAFRNDVPHPVLGLSWADVEAYYERMTGPEVPEGSTYSYGSRMRGSVDPACLGLPSIGPDQIERVNVLLAAKPYTRAAFLSPWRPEEDAGLEGGRPCLVGVWFRAVAERGETDVRQRSTLHLTICFRSHDLANAYPTNLAAACLWLVKTAEAHGMAVGTLTCLSMSAHIYEHAYKAAQDAVKAYKPKPGPRWDQRAAWHVAVRVDRRLQATVTTPDGSNVVAGFEAKTPETLLRDIAESGLIQETGSALWLGREVERVRRSR